MSATSLLLGFQLVEFDQLINRSFLRLSDGKEKVGYLQIMFQTFLGLDTLFIRPFGDDGLAIMYIRHGTCFSQSTESKFWSIEEASLLLNH